MAEQSGGKSWARKYRPKGLAEYLGADVKRTLETRFSDSSHLPQVVLFYGPRGTGKTTAARLLAKDYQCLSPVNGHACGHCEMCVELDEKLIDAEPGVEPMGVSEIDIAAEGSKSNIDDIINQAIEDVMPPLKYKILIMDEFHMANKAVQNRLLKIMEEPPKHLCMFLCTTNPEAILPTILSRCQVKIQVRKADIGELAGRLQDICRKERVTCSEAALRQIAKQADRVPREAITLLEQVALSNDYQVTLEAIAKVTGAVATETYLAYYKAANTSLEDILQFTNKLKKSDTTCKDFIKGLTKFTLDCIKIRYGIGLEDYAPEYVKAVKEMFKMYSTEEMDCLLQILEYANRALGDSDDTKEELTIVTTAMRIGRVGVLNNGLASEGVAANKENRKGTKLYSETHREELAKQNRSVRTGSADAMIADIYGATTVMMAEKPVIAPEAGPSISDAEVEAVANEDDEAFFARFMKGDLGPEDDGEEE